MNGGHLRHVYVPSGHVARGDRQRDTGAHPQDTGIPPRQDPGEFAAASGDKRRGISLGLSTFGPNRVDSFSRAGHNEIVHVYLNGARVP